MKSLVRFAWLLPLFCLSSCVKENFEDVQIEVELPEPPVVYVVDCETMGLNVGDPCVVSSNNPAVDGLDGVVNDNCNCQPTAPPAGPVVTVAFWRQYGGAPLTVSTASDPPFLSGPDEVSISVGLTEVEFRFPPNTQSCSLQHSYLCAGQPRGMEPRGDGIFSGFGCRRGLCGGECGVFRDCRWESRCGVSMAGHAVKVKPRWSDG